MSNISGVTKYFPTVNEGFTTTLNGSVAVNAAILPLNSVSGLTDGSVFVGIIEPGDATKQQVFTGTVDVAGARLTGCVYTRGTSASGHAGGVTIVDYVTGTAFNMISKGMQVQHGQDGLHNTAAATTIASLLPSASVAATALAGSIPYSKLLSTIFSGQVTSFTNTGTGGGTFYYVNIGGIKLLWGIFGNVSLPGSTGSTAGATLTLPSGFFSSIQAITHGGHPGGDVRTVTQINTYDTSNVQLYIWNTVDAGVGATTSNGPHLFIIGT
jgi:hypothetical protein